MERCWIVLAVLTSARLAMGFQFQSLAAVSPGLGDLALTQADLGLLVGLYFLPGIAMALPGGALGRSFGDKRVVVSGLVLMAVGGAVCALARDFWFLVVGRLISGTGGVLLNVLMSKMVIDWFAGRKDLSLAMAIFVNSFPAGVGLAIAVLGPVAVFAGWPTAMNSTSLAAAAALVLVVLAYRPHSNDRGGGAVGRGITAREVATICTAGGIWGLYNGCFAVMFSFAAPLLTGSGISQAATTGTGAVATWLVVASILLGGILLQQGTHAASLFVLSTVGWSACLLAMASGGPFATFGMLAAGFVMGLPVAVIMSLPARALAPESRAVGMGLFYTWLYIGHASLPPIAGLVGDATGSTAMPIVFAAGLAMAMLPLYFTFRWLNGAVASEPKPS